MIRAAASTQTLGGTKLEWLVSKTQIQMRVLTARLIVALLTFAIGIAVAGFWFTYRAPAVQTLGLPPCASPPDYELVSVPCADPDLSVFASMPMIPYCDLVRDSAGYENKVIRVKGIYSFNMENSALDDPTCRRENAWTWVEFEPYSRFDESMKSSYSTHGARMKSGGNAAVIFLGKFSGPSDEGYGHLNGCRYQLTVMKVEEMKALTLNVR
ncbi:MAG TPA: hypothetical protein VGJ48_16770 [Pyrinomonadaceae bacterium]